MREYRLLNNNWKFTYGDKVGASPDEINRWQDIGLPHSFGIPYFMEKEFTFEIFRCLSKGSCRIEWQADWGTSGRLHTIFGRINRKYTAGTKSFDCLRR